MKITNYMGNTPLVNIKNIYGYNYGSVWVKLEKFNPGGSVKSRVGFQMIYDAELSGRLKSGDHLLEPTGGNTGLGLAVPSSIKGYKLTLVIPDNFSNEKMSVLKQYGAEIILSDHKTGPGSHIRLANEILKSSNKYICLDQFSNLSNPKAHYLTTGVEIIKQMNGNIAAFICSIGSGGTIVGVGNRLKEFNENIKIFAVQPKECDILNGIFNPHKIEATAVGMIPDFVNKDKIDGTISIDFDEVQELRKHLCKKEGLFVGISSGANILAALKLSKKYTKENNIITVAPDSGRSYL
ncbi:cysteine synthase family protein [Xenorhabdus sp. TH1]|uniref:PLP-dependent cysteine synthase family protein n=1 Tax=Xenorhabdus sp. TH1 TaxID=3130166 RepID=UPI0030CEFF70